MIVEQNLPKSPEQRMIVELDKCETRPLSRTRFQLRANERTLNLANISGTTNDR